MNITFVILSPTFGMHQYTADLANRVAQGPGIRDQEPGVEAREAREAREAADGLLAAGHCAQLVTTTTLPRDRYNPAVEIHTPVTTHGTGFSREALDIAAYRRVVATVLSAVKTAQPSVPQPFVPQCRAGRSGCAMEWAASSLQQPTCASATVSPGHGFYRSTIPIVGGWDWPAHTALVPMNLRRRAARMPTCQTED